MKRTVVMVVWLVIAWVALWQDLSAANVLTGVVAAVALVLLFPVGGRGRGTHLRLLATARFAAFFAWKLVEANAIVAWQVLRPARTVVEGIVAAPLRTTSEGIATVVADAVTLTPGTMTIDIARDDEGAIVLYVHVLQLGDPDAIRADVTRFEDLALAAFGDRAEQPGPAAGGGAAAP